MEAREKGRIEESRLWGKQVFIYFNVKQQNYK